MVRPEVLRRRLEKLQEYLRILEGLAQVTEAEFLADPRIHGSAERFLQLAIEALLGQLGHGVHPYGSQKLLVAGEELLA
ncbi:MAG: DUF86 domain-containing protein, partial [Candidatus Bipolaricaulota bacterium]|nr:DUF86 domain-containing protein [Candidatus Bipolaricaulota bacterium]